MDHDMVSLSGVPVFCYGETAIGTGQDCLIYSNPTWQHLVTMPEARWEHRMTEMPNNQFAIIGKGTA